MDSMIVNFLEPVAKGPCADDWLRVFSFASCQHDTMTFSFLKRTY